MSNHLQWLSATLIVLLSACSGVSPATDETPATEAARQVTFVEIGESEDLVEEVQPEPVAEVTVAEAGENVDVAAQAAEAPSLPENAETAVEAAPEEAEAELAEAPAAGEKVMPEDVIVNHSAPSPEQQQLLASLNVLGQPPELFNEVWLNSEPLKLADLRGKVVIVEFWTFG